MNATLSALESLNIERATGISISEIRSLVLSNMECGIIRMAPPPAPEPRSSMQRKSRKKRGENFISVLSTANSQPRFESRQITSMSRETAITTIRNLVKRAHLVIVFNGHGSVPNQYAITEEGRKRLEEIRNEQS